MAAQGILVPLVRVRISMSQPIILTCGVTVAPQILVLLVWVRILARQQKIKKYLKDFF